MRDVAPAHQLQVAFTVGRSRLDQDPAFVGNDEVQDGVNDVAVGVITWRYLVTPRFILTQRISADGNASRNVNRDGVELHRGQTQRRDVSRGLDLLAIAATHLRGRWRRSPLEGIPLRSGIPAQPGVYAARKLQRVRVRRIVLCARAHRQRAGHLRAGSAGRSFDTDGTHISVTVDRDAMAARRFPDRARAGGGIYRQEPEFVEVKGLRGSDLDAMRSYHADIGFEGPLARSMTWQVSAYDREDRAYAWLPGAEFRVENGRLVLPSFTTRYENALDGHSRGVELAVKRRSPNGLSGWVAYNLAFTEYHNTRQRRDLRRRLRPAAHVERVRRLPPQRSHELQRAFPCR